MPLPSDPPNGYFACWQKLAFNDPEGAAEQFYTDLESLSESERQSALSWLPSKEILTANFIQAATRSDPVTGLSGVPFMLKDLFDVEGIPTHCSSTFLPEVRGIPKTSCRLYNVLNGKGGVFSGKTHMNEFAYGLDGRNPHFGHCSHPTHPDRLSGGSSSGSAWAVGKKLVPLAFGSDTGGSIRVPAAFCGLYGYRTEPNEWITEGGVPLAPSFDTPGWFTATATDMAASLRTLLKPREPLKPGIGFYIDLFDQSVEPELARQYREMTRKFDLIIDPPHREVLEEILGHVELHYSVLQSKEAYDVHREWHEPFKDRYDPVVWQRIDRGRHWTKNQVIESLAAQDHLLDLFADLFIDFDYLVLPVTPCVAFRGEDNRSALLRMNTPGSFARKPILTIPVFLPNGLSGGLQFIFRNTASPFPLDILERLD